MVHIPMATKAPPSTYQIHISLNRSKPPIWRRVLVSNAITLPKLHDVLQTAMGWTDAHPHQFIAGGKLYGVPDDEFGLEFTDGRKVKLGQLLKQEGDRLIYEYDFGDGWEHTVLLEKVLPADSGTRLPTCTAGRRACPPEDCGGIAGYAALLEAVQDPKHPEHEEILAWIGEDFDPEHVDLDSVNAELSRL